MPPRTGARAPAKTPTNTTTVANTLTAIPPSAAYSKPQDDNVCPWIDHTRNPQSRRPDFSAWNQTMDLQTAQRILTAKANVPTCAKHDSQHSSHQREDCHHSSWLRNWLTGPSHRCYLVPASRAERTSREFTLSLDTSGSPSCFAKIGHLPKSETAPLCTAPNSRRHGMAVPRRCSTECKEVHADEDVGCLLEDRPCMDVRCEIVRCG